MHNTPRVLVTGATGYIGQHALEPLVSQGYEVHAVTSQAVDTVIPLFANEVQWHQANLLDQAQVESVMQQTQPTHVLHFAWYVEHGSFWTAPENVQWRQASEQLLDAFVRIGGERFVAAGTCAEFAWTDETVCVEGTTPLNPHTLYGQEKLAFHKKLLQATCSHAWGYIYLSYGPYEPPNRLVPSVIRHLLNGEEAACSHGEQIRDILHVADIADAFVSLLMSEVMGDVNIGSGKPIALKDTIRTIGECTGKPELIQLGALPARADDPAVLIPDITRLRDEVGWTQHIDLQSGIRDTVAWWEQHL